LRLFNIRPELTGQPIDIAGVDGSSDAESSASSTTLIPNYEKFFLPSAFFYLLQPQRAAIDMMNL
jgi:hypothetical protein